MTQLTFDIPESALVSLHRDPEPIAREFRIAAAIQRRARKALSPEGMANLVSLYRLTSVNTPQR